MGPMHPAPSGLGSNERQQRLTLKTQERAEVQECKEFSYVNQRREGAAGKERIRANKLQSKNMQYLSNHIKGLQQK